MSIDLANRTWTIKAPKVGEEARPLVAALLEGAGVPKAESERLAGELANVLERDFGANLVLGIPRLAPPQRLERRTAQAIVLWADTWAREAWEEMLRRAVRHVARAELERLGISLGQ